MRVALIYEGYPDWVARGRLGAAEAYIKAGDSERAKKLLENVIEKHGEDEFAQEARKRLREL